MLVFAALSSLEKYILMTIIGTAANTGTSELVRRLANRLDRRKEQTSAPIIIRHVEHYYATCPDGSHT